MDKEQSAYILKSIALALNLKFQDMAEQTGINKQQFYDYTAGKILPSWGTLVKIKTAFPSVSSDFILTGKGSVLSA